jgi:hypothetical protein
MLATISVITALLTAITTLIVTLRNSLTTKEIHSMVKADATPAALHAAMNARSKLPPAATSTFVVTMSFLATFAGCAAAKEIVASAPSGPICDLVAIGSGSTFAGVVCSDVAGVVKAVVAALPATLAAQQSAPCKLSAIHHKGASDYAGSVCSVLAPQVQAEIDK